MAKHINAPKIAQSISSRVVNKSIKSLYLRHAQKPRHEKLANLSDFFVGWLQCTYNITYLPAHHMCYTLAHSKSSHMCRIYAIYTYVDFFDFNETIKPQNTPDQYHVGVRMPFHLSDVPDLAVLQQYTGVDVDEQRPLYIIRNRPEQDKKTTTKKNNI